MTNTHINVGGHKITTNKVGQVHTVPLNGSYVTPYSVRYIVVNGICVATAYLDNIVVTAGEITVATGLPTPKMDIEQNYPNTRTSSTIYTQIRKNNGTGELRVGNNDAGAYTYCTWVYPVADDWVES